MRILVTGGAGFIGSHVVDECIAAGHDVAVVDNFWQHGGGRRANLNPKAKLHEIDIRDKDVHQVVRSFRPDVVSHHAAQHSVAISTADPDYDADVNIRGLINVLEACASNGVKKFIFASSAATYGTPQYLPINETHPQLPESPYGITKMAAEHYLRYYAAAKGLSYTALRYGNVYGPRQDPNGEAGVIAIFARRILTHEPVRIDWDGEQQKDYVYVGDVARASRLALDHGDNDAFCIATGKGTSVNEIYRALAKIIGYEVEIVRAPRRPGDIYLSYFDCSKAERVLGWKAQVSLEEGMRATVQFFSQ